MKVIRLIFVFILTISAAGCVKKDEFPILKGPYLGQKPPGMTPEVFAPGILSKTQPEWAFSSSFSPHGHEFYFTKFNQSAKIDQIMFMRRVNDTWTRPRVAPFNSQHTANDPRISPDGYRLFFRSKRPLPGNKTPEKYFYIWFVTRTRIGWSEPQPVECGNIHLRTGDLGIANNGTLYFSYRISNISGVFRSRFVKGAYSSPEFVCSKIKTEWCEGDTFVAPDESYIIVSCWNLPKNKGESDLYISFRKKDGSWTALKNMGKPINTENNENCATLSPDGKYFFYIGVDGKSKIPRCATYWVDAKIIEDLKPKELR